jgi:hypothetical protein
MLRRVLCCFVLTTLAAGLMVLPAQAQTRLALEAGPLLPSGDMADVVDASAWFGARLEIQRVNALGQAAALGIIVRAGYADLATDSDYEAQFGDAKASYFDIGVGARAYSVALPFFVSADLAWSRFEASDESSNGVTPSLGLGLEYGLGGAFVEFEARGHIAFLNEDNADNLTFVTLTAALGLPF